VKPHPDRSSVDAVRVTTPLHPVAPVLMLTVVGVTLSTTVSRAVGHGGLALLVTVSTNWTVPVPVKVAVGPSWSQGSIVTGALSTDHAAVPKLALPAKVNGVVPSEPTHLV